MRGIGDFLEKFKRFSPPDESVRKSAAEAIFEIIGRDIGHENIRLSNGILYLDINPAIKTVICVRKELILAAIRKKMGEKTPRDLR